MVNFKHFDWGSATEKDIKIMSDECTKNIYEKYFNVEENDIVVDIGAFVGDFTYTILDKNPEHCWVIEPVESFFRTLYKNLKNHPISFVRCAISDNTKLNIDNAPIIDFNNFITINCIDKIDFLKIDCEGGEYSIFNEKNIYYLKHNVLKIASEFHLNSNSEDLRTKFKYFRDNIITQFDNYQINSVDGVDIKWDLFNDHFIQYYNEILIYIDNR